MNNRRFLLLLLCAALAWNTAAEDRKAAVEPGPASMASPILGYFVSGSRIVSIEGVNGAAHTRELHGARGASDRVILPPGQNYQWIERAGHINITPMPAGNAQTIPEAWTGADLVSFNSDGSAAVLYRNSGRVQVITGLTGTPSVARELTAPAGVTAIAMSDDASTLLLASAQGVYAASTNNPWHLVLPGAVNAIAFVPGGSDALVASKDQTFFLKSAMTAEFLTNDNARAIATSADGHFGVFLASSGTEATVVDLRTRTTKNLQLGATAQDVQRGRNSAILFIPRQGTSPWLFDTSSGVLSFAPALPETARVR